MEMCPLKKVLVTYCTRYGSTAEVAEEIAKVFVENGLTATVVNLRENKTDLLIDDYDGVVVGSSIKAGQWTKEAKNFLKEHKEKLASKPLALFVCCGDAVEEKLKDKAQSEYLEAILAEVGLESQHYEAFPGVFDFSNETNMGWMDRKILAAVMKRRSENASSIDTRSRNDFRDWDAIREFAKRFIST